MRGHWTRFRETVAPRYPALVPIVDAVAAYPQLRSLFPFTSMCTQFPYDVDFLISYSDSTYFAELTLDDGGWVHTEPIGQGSAAEATAVVASRIPERYGPAQPGTAEGLPPSPVRAARSSHGPKQ
jgi:hypothetical protein